MDSTAHALALTTNAVLNSFVIMNKCLINNRALKPGQFSRALKETFNHPAADWDRVDYQFFQDLARLLEEAETRDRRPNPPS